MSAISDLDQLIRSMNPELTPETYVFATTPDLALARAARAQMVFREAEGLTLILSRAEARRLGLEPQFPCRMITLNIHSSLDAVGFLARITARLAGLGMGVNPVSAYFHDHLFVPEARADEALEALRAMAREG
jgi:hypothetical protein